MELGEDSDTHCCYLLYIFGSIIIIAFDQWKDTYEEDNVCSFIKKTGRKTDVQYFQCNRTGVHVSTGTGQRRIKSQGTLVLK